MPAPSIPPFEEIAETFELLDDWEDRYRYVIDLGKALPGLADDKRTAATKVDGCASQVWLDVHVGSPNGGAPVLRFAGDSDAHIVRGLIAILQSLYDGAPAAEVAAASPLARFASLGLDTQLSAQRSNGLASMVRRLQERAAAG